MNKSMKNYAVLNSFNVVIGVSQLSSEVDSEQHVIIDTYDLNLMGSKYNADSGTFINLVTNGPVDSNPIKIKISSVFGAVMTSSDFTHITCNELTNITITGTVAVPDRTFSMPIRRDDGRLILFPVTVVNGAFEAVLNFPTSGQYSYSDVEANIDLPANTFSVAPIKLDVLRQAT
ncbi:hypothetical protein L5M43_20275 [Shewanella sp. SW36]|uniref:hypothetical protein n=1 Tax=unclassified Shewanella TaxID=196818 RepID=UPI0021DAE086|nr:MULTISPECIES: hypothetical protein [unclassified Shewanella]MCU7977558.1 hypothetical protein [Shewanella sp. SW36]MCU7992816.1 hypothetical protein [Shewanella sp. SW1]MCU8054061.1 hypothetical protein [Shewanella sp. SM43]